MAGFTASEWVSRPPREVFEVVTGPQHAPQIVSSVTSMVAITDGPLRVGTRFRETRVMRGREQTAELEVVAHDPDREYALANVTAGIETVYRYTFRPESGGTRVDLVCDVTARGPRRLLVPAVVAVLRKEDGDHLQRVKRALETGRDAR